MAFSKLLLKEAEVAVAPGIGFGEYGEGFVRLGLVENEQRIRQAARKVKQVLGQTETMRAAYTPAEAADMTDAADWDFEHQQAETALTVADLRSAPTCRAADHPAGPGVRPGRGRHGRAGRLRPTSWGCSAIRPSRRTPEVAAR